jgi:hydrogenase/urease accessory protein HupE
MSAFLTEGLLHPLVTPSHLILLLGIALLIGQQAKLKTGISIFIVTFVIGLIANRLLTINDLPIEEILLSIAFVIGMLTVLKLNLPSFVVIIITAIAAFFAGYDSTPIIMFGISLQKIVTWQVGATIASTSMIILAGLLTYYLRHLLQGVALRVMASWIATAALLVLTLSLAG